MLKKLFAALFISLMTASSFLSAEIEYDIHDIGTLQTRESQAIALNNKGQILGWYNIDGTKEGKHFFVRDKDGTFHEIPNKENGTGWEINWRFLTSEGKVYGTFDGNSNYSVLYVWDEKNMVVKLGNLPSKEISAINNSGQVLIHSIVENENGKSIRRPVIWDNGKTIKLNRLEGNTGIPSDESYGIDMNNKGEVVGRSLVYLSYKNALYKQFHATKWVNGEAIDLHNTIPKSIESEASAVNDKGDVIINGYLIHKDGCRETRGSGGANKKSNMNYFYSELHVVDTGCNAISNHMEFVNRCINDFNLIWFHFNNFIAVNDNGEIIAEAMTIYGERHAILLVPKKN